MGIRLWCKVGVRPFASKPLGKALVQRPSGGDVVCAVRSDRLSVHAFKVSARGRLRSDDFSPRTLNTLANMLTDDDSLNEVNSLQFATRMDDNEWAAAVA